MSTNAYGLKRKNSRFLDILGEWSCAVGMKIKHEAPLNEQRSVRFQFGV